MLDIKENKIDAAITALSPNQKRRQKLERLGPDGEKGEERPVSLQWVYTAQQKRILREQKC